MSANPPETPDDPAGDHPELITCHAVADLYSANGRHAIAGAAREYLQDNALLPVDLLHDPALYDTFAQHSLRQAAVDRAARAQAWREGISTGHRQQAIDQLIHAAHKQATEWLADAALPALTPQSMTDHVGRVAGRDLKGRFLATATVLRHLASADGYAGRASALLGLAGADPDPGTAQVVDSILADLVDNPVPLRATLGSPGTLARLLEDLCDVFLAAAPLRQDAPAVLRQVKSFLAGQEAPETRAALVRSLHRELASPQRMKPLSDQDLLQTQSLVDELLAISTLASKMRISGRFIGGSRTPELLERRVALLVSEDRLAEVLRGKSYYAKIVDLFNLQKAVFGDASRRAVDDYLLHFLESRELPARLMDSARVVEDRIRTVTHVQKLVQDSLLGTGKKRDLAQALDNMELTLVRAKGLLQRNDHDRNDVSHALLILDLCAEGALTEPQVAEAARAFLEREIRRPQFIRAFMAGQQGGQEIAATMERLRHKLKAAKVSFRDLGSLQVMVVEDEKASMDYICMILNDMGISRVVTAEDGRAALDRFAGREDEFDLIIADWKMPRMSGLEFLKQVRTVRPSQPFLMVTALAQMAAVEEAMTHEVTAYIAKPFPPEQLEEKVLVLINRNFHGETAHDAGAEPSAGESSPKSSG